MHLLYFAKIFGSSIHLRLKPRNLLSRAPILEQNQPPRVLSPTRNSRWGMSLFGLARARVCVFSWSVVCVRAVCTRVDTMRAWQCKNESSFNLGKETDKRICLLSLHMWVRVSWRPFSGYARCRCRGWIKRRQRSNSN